MFPVMEELGNFRKIAYKDDFLIETSSLRWVAAVDSTSETPLSERTPSRAIERQFPKNSSAVVPDMDKSN